MKLWIKATKLVAIIICIVNFTQAQVTKSIVDHILFDGKLITACVENTLYKNKTFKGYFIKFQILNNSDDTIGIDLGGVKNFNIAQLKIDSQERYIPTRDTIIYANNYSPRIDEAVSPAIQNDSINEAMIELFHTNKLVTIPPKQMFEYFTKHVCTKTKYFSRTRNGQVHLSRRKKNRGRKCVKIKSKQILIMRFDGVFLATNGKIVEQVCFTKYAKKEEREMKRTLFLYYPVKWKKLPPNAVFPL